MTAASTSDLFYIASVKHTSKGDEHITWWGRNRCGYTPVIGEHIGEYGAAEAAKLNDGIDHIAVPVDAVRALASPEPYFRPYAPMRFYDQRGPVIDNSRANWNRLIAMSIVEGRLAKPKPEVFRGTRRTFGLSEPNAEAPDQDPSSRAGRINPEPSAEIGT